MAMLKGHANLYLSISSQSSAPSDIGQTPECSICSERYDDSVEDLIPRNLSCGHSLCSKCIFKCIQLNGRSVTGGTLVSCPSKCSQNTFVPEGLVHNLPKNFAVLDIVQDYRERSPSISSGRNRSPSLGVVPNFNTSTKNLQDTSCTDEYKCDVCETRGATIVCPSCAVCLCVSCSEDIHSRKGYHLHQLVPVMEFINSEESLASTSSNLEQQELDISLEERRCKLHANEFLEYSCEVCNEEICKICRLSDEHKDHESKLLLDIAIEKKESLRHAINEIEDCHSIWNQGFDECHELQEVLYERSRGVVKAIKDKFLSIHSLLHDKEKSILSQLGEEVDTRVNSLQKQADHLYKVCVVAKDLGDTCEQLLHYGTDSEIFRDADRILNQAQQYVHSEQDATPSVACSMEIDFSSEDKLIGAIDAFGELMIAPSRVEDLKVVSTMSSTSEVSLTWKPSLMSLTRKCPLSFIVEHSVRGRSAFECIYDGQACECVLEDCQINKDTVHMFRVAAVNEIGKGPYCVPVSLNKQKVSFLWSANMKHPKARISNNGYSVSIGENATWVSVGTDAVLSHGRHYWEVVLDRYGNASLSRKVVVGVVLSDYHQWHRSHGVIGIKTCPIGSRSWGLACGTAKKLSSGSTFFNSLGRKHNLFREGDSVGVLLDLTEHTLAFYRNGEPLGLQFNDIYGPVVPAISFCRNKKLTLRFPPLPADKRLSRSVEKASTSPQTHHRQDLKKMPLTM